MKTFGEFLFKEIADINTIAKFLNSQPHHIKALVPSLVGWQIEKILKLVNPEVAEAIRKHIKGEPTF